MMLAAVCAILCTGALAVPFAAGDRVAVFGPGESPFGSDVAARMQLSWDLEHADAPVDFHDATYRNDAMEDGFRRWEVDVAGVRPTHVLSLFGETPGTAGFESDLRLFVLKVRSEGAKPVFATPSLSDAAGCRVYGGADVVRRVACEEDVPLVDVKALLTKDRADAPARALAAYDGLVTGERTLRTYDDMRFAAQAHGMYLGDNIVDENPTADAWNWWIKAGGDCACRSNAVERWKTLYGKENEWRAKTESFRAELREKTK